MNLQQIRTTELRKALSRLIEALAAPKNDLVRDSVIQRFEFTVELSWKLLQRFLKSSGVSEELTPKSVFREAARLNLVSDPESWIHFINERNLSSHTYQEALAEQVFESAKKLPPFVEELILKIEAQLK